MKTWWLMCVITFIVFVIIHPMAGFAFFVGLIAMDTRHSIFAIKRLREILTVFESRNGNGNRHRSCRKTPSRGLRKEQSDNITRLSESGAADRTAAQQHH